MAMYDGLDIGDPADWLENEHAGQILLVEFLAPGSLTVEQLAQHIDTEPAGIAAVITGLCPVDPEMDLRLGRYFGMSEGFFLRLQGQYEALEAKRATVN